jgi:hypothetical protein
MELPAAVLVSANNARSRLFIHQNTEWLQKLESLFFILPRYVAVFKINMRIKKYVYLIKWQHRIHFVQLSLFLTIGNVTVSE